MKRHHQTQSQLTNETFDELSSDSLFPENNQNSNNLEYDVWSLNILQASIRDYGKSIIDNPGRVPNSQEKI